MSILNPELLRLAKEQAKKAAAAKRSFVDPSMAAAGGAPPMDPSMMGGAPPMDPSMMGGAPPMDPSMMGGGGAAPTGGGMTPEDVRAIVQEVVAQQGGGTGGGAGAGEKKMKVDVNQEIYQIKKLLVLMAEEMGLPVPPSLLLGDPAQDPHVPDSEAAKDPLSSASAGQQAQSAIPPIEPMPAASPALAAGGGGEPKTAVHRGQAVASPEPTARQTTDRARALLAQLNAAGRT